MGSKTRSTTKEGDHRPGLSAPPPVSVEEACQLHERAVALREHGQHAEAATCARHALASFERECGPDHPDVANILNNLAGICTDQGDYAEAARLAQRAVAIMEQATGSPDLELLRVQSLRTLAGVYRAQGRYAEAESLYQRALAGRKPLWVRTTSKQPPASMTWPCSTNIRPSLPRPRGCIGAPWPSLPGRLAPSTPTWPRSTTTWADWSTPADGMLVGSHGHAVPWLSVSEHLGPTTRQWPPMWLPWRPSWMRKAMTPRRKPCTGAPWPSLNASTGQITMRWR